MINFTYIKPNNFMPKIVRSKIKIKNEYIGIIKEFYDKYKNKTIEANSDIRSFLEQIGYLDYIIIEGESFTKGNGRFDLVLGLDKDSGNKTLIELKIPNSNDMIEYKSNNKSNFYKKAFYQAIYYYLSDDNSSLFNKIRTNIKYLIITDYISWYFIETSEIEKLNKIEPFPDINNIETLKAYQIIENYLKNITIQNNLFQDDIVINYTSFYLKDTIKDDEQLKLFLKYLSPQYLLDNLDIVDKNHITNKFYQELFYIIGLKENKKNILEPLDNQFSFIPLIKEKLPISLNDNEKFEIAIELVLLWINRILFIQLYSSILVKYKILNKPILNTQTHYIFDDINDLFFNILNKKDNRPKIKKELNFDKIPYINSSLFQKSEIEIQYSIYIANLSSNKIVDIYPTTNIKESKQELEKKELNILEYLILFLNSYDIAVDENFSDSSDNDLINASILGMVFEKLNGYKDGAFFTPSYITEYMTKNSIENLIIKKFNDNGLKGNTILELRDNFRIKDLNLAKQLFNSITICDPAVGSGHFLVSALNAMLLYKARLGLYENIEYNQLDIIDDMLVVKNIDDYNKDMRDTKVHSIYEELYQSKQQIISNSLFGVDINPKSVYISRLRLWIELLKHTYFTNNKELVLLPNIDVNIKQGNSLIFNIKLDEDFNNLFDVDIFNKYKELILQYKDPLNNRSDIQEQIDLIKIELDEQFNNKNKFEWRYEFPEILDNNGKFVGFDIVIINPPYVRQELIKDLKSILKEKYNIFTSTADLYTYFYELALKLLKNNGILAFISSNKFCRADYGYNLRVLLKENTTFLSIVDFEKQKQFKEATTDTIIMLLKKQKPNKNIFNVLDSKLDIKYNMKQSLLNSSHYTFANSDTLELYRKITSKGTPLKEWNVKIKRGILTGLNEAFIVDEITKDELIEKDKNNSDIIVPILKGADIKKYKTNFSNEYMINTHNNPPVDIEKYPIIKKYLDNYLVKLEKRSDRGDTIYNLRDCNFIKHFTDKKIIWQELTDRANFTLDTNGYYTLAGTFIMYGTNLEYIVAILNSKLIEWYFHLMANSSGTGTMQWKKTFVERLPIPKIDKRTQNSIIKLVKEILDPNNINFSNVKNKIDKKIYQIYNLSNDEIEIIEKWHKNKFYKYKKIRNTKNQYQGSLL